MLFDAIQQGFDNVIFHQEQYNDFLIFKNISATHCYQKFRDQ